MRNFGTILIAVIAYSIYALFFKIEYSPIIQTSSGQIRGFLAQSRLGKSYYKFLAIPYAVPPLGKLRFLNPQPISEPWEGVRDAVNFGHQCVQVDALSRKIIGNEDCLTLQIFSPKSALENGKLLPTIFYIHGGYFMMGTAKYMAPDYLLDEDSSVLVTIQYRLNVFGFLNTGDSASHANVGLKDQVLALQWCRENIYKFGGDPERISISGQSAGSAAVHFHLLSDMSKGLFSGAIMSSGTAIKPWSLVDNPLAQAQNLGKKLNCPTNDPKELVDCLRKMDAYTIISSFANALSTPIMNPLEIFAPSIENCEKGDKNCFLPAHPYEILQRGPPSKVPILTGINSEDGFVSTARIKMNESLKEFVSSNWNTLSPIFFLYDQSQKELTAKIRKFYIDDDGNGKIAFDEKFQNITDAFSDRLYIHSTREMARMQSKFSPVYLYYFNYSLHRGIDYMFDIDPNLPIFMQFVWKEIKWHINEYLFPDENDNCHSGHGDDIALIFKFPVIRLPPGSVDFSMSRQMVKLWTDFAKDPKSLTFGGNKWSPISTDSKELQYMLISKAQEHGSLIDEPFAQRMKFWDELKLPWIRKDV